MNKREYKPYVSKAIPEPYTNIIGQTIKVGDEVLYVANAWKQTYVRKGKYKGKYFDSKGNFWAIRVDHKYGISRLELKRAYILA